MVVNHDSIEDFDDVSSVFCMLLLAYHGAVPHRKYLVVDDVVEFVKLADVAELGLLGNNY